MEKAQRMQQWMMSNPQEAMKWAQAQQQLGADTQTVGPEINAASMQFENEKKDLVAGYGAALKQAGGARGCAHGSDEREARSQRLRRG